MLSKPITNAFHAAGDHEVAPRGGLGLENPHSFRAIENNLPLTVIGPITHAAVLEYSGPPSAQVASLSEKFGFNLG